MAAEAPTAAGVEEVHILWISEGMSCDGDTVSITAAGQPGIEDVLLGAIPGLPKVNLHNKVLSPTLGGEVRFQWAPPPGASNLPPWDGLQSFGTIDVAPDALAIALWGIDGRARHRVEIPWQP